MEEPTTPKSDFQQAGEETLPDAVKTQKKLKKLRLKQNAMQTSIKKPNMMKVVK